MNGLCIAILGLVGTVSAKVLHDDAAPVSKIESAGAGDVERELRHFFELPLLSIPDAAALNKMTDETDFSLSAPTMLGIPHFPTLLERLKAKDLTLGSPIYMRIFKRESKLELWMKRGEQFEKFQTYPICAWSGTLGPKLKEGDRQSPEGFYQVSRGQLNPNSRYHRSFNLGYPNRFDKAHKRTGSYLMVHGACVSIGCYAMTDGQIDEIWTIVNAAFDKGQKKFNVHAFPFALTNENLTQMQTHRWFGFWQQLKPAYDYFEMYHRPPKIDVCHNAYQVNRKFDKGIRKLKASAPCPRSDDLPRPIIKTDFQARLGEKTPEPFSHKSTEKVQKQNASQ